jgi:hypothetical protein
MSLFFSHKYPWGKKRNISLMITAANLTSGRSSNIFNFGLMFYTDIKNTKLFVKKGDTAKHNTVTAAIRCRFTLPAAGNKKNDRIVSLLKRATKFQNHGSRLSNLHLHY